MDEDKVFSDLKFVIAECNNAEAIKTILIEGGAKHINYLSEHVTLVVADVNCPEAEEAIELFDKPVVSSRWVYLSLKAKRLLPFEAFSPIKSIFHRVVATFASDVVDSDIEILAATLTYYGARVSRNVARATHYIVCKADASNIPGETHNLKIVAPDWVFESVRQNVCCDEKLFDPSLLLPPKPPKPPTPPPPPTPPQIEEQVSKQEEQAASILNEEQLIKIDQSSNRTQTQTYDIQYQSQVQMQKQHSDSQCQQKIHQQLQSQTNHTNQQAQALPTQVPRPRMQNNNVRGVQHKFRPILPPNNVPGPARQMMQPQRIMVPDGHQGRKVTINIDHRKPNPYQNNLDSQQIVPLHQPNSYATNQQLHMQQQQSQSTVIGVQQSARPHQPNIYNQVRPGFQNNQIQPRNPTHPTMLSQPQHQPHQHQSPSQQQPHGQMINRFQDPNMQQNLRPYQVNIQPQPVNSNYHPGNMHRQQIYYTQNSNQMQIRMPQQQSSNIRHAQNDQALVYDNFSPQLVQSPRHGQHHIQAHELSQQQPHYQIQQPQQSYNPQQQQQIPPTNQIAQPQVQLQSQSTQHQQIPQQPIISPPRPQIQQNFTGTPPGPYQVRPARILFNNQQEPKATNVRPQRISGQSIRAPVPAQSRSPSQPVPQPQPHPSIFDSTQESNLAQIKAKVPSVIENFTYYGHDPKGNVTKELPLTSCKFKIIDYEDIHPSFKIKWCNAIKAAGGSITENLQDVTILICENRLSTLYTEAVKLSIRCVTVYWLNDVLAQKCLTYPWKALHLPVPFSKSNRPLINHNITITNFKNKERREVKDMILKTGAKYTEYFSTKNSLVVCGNVGGDKYDRAIEWKIPIANCRILSDIMISENFQSLETMLTQTKYQLFNRGDPLKLTTYSDVRELMKPWTKPIPVDDKRELEDQKSSTNDVTKNSANAMNSNEDSGIATGGSTNNDLDTSFTVKIDTTDSTIIKTETNCQERSDIANISKEVDANQAVVQTKKVRTSTDPIRILFTHLEPSLIDRLTKYAVALDLGFANGPTNCTHLIVDRISRTHKFICAFSHAKYIVSHRWLIESYEAKSLLDESQFILQDDEGETRFSFKLTYSLMKRRKHARLIFDGFVFFVTPSVLSDVSKLKEMIESAGGMICTKKLPTKLQLKELKVEKKRFVVVSCHQDLHLCSSLDISIPKVGVEFILSGILRQDIDFDAHQLVGDANSSKKARLED